jgi:integrase
MTREGVSVVSELDDFTGRFLYILYIVGVSKPHIKFPYTFTKNGRVGKVYYAKSTGTFKTHFQFGGEAIQNTFKTTDAAVSYLEREFAKLDTDRANSLALNPLNADVRTYSELEQLLRDKGNGATLRDAVSFYIIHHPTTRFQPMTVEKCAEQYVAAQKADNVSPIHITTLEKHFRRFNKGFGNRKINEVTTLEIAEWLRSQKDASTGSLWSVKTRTSNLGSLVGLSLFAQRTLHAIPDLGHTEFQKVKRPKADSRPAVEIYDPSEILALLLEAIDTDIDMIPAVVVGAFQGLRPFEFHAEDAKRPPLTWEAVNWNDNRLHVSGQKIRSKATRDIPLHPVTRAWLTPFREQHGVIWRYKQAHSKKLIALRARAGVQSIYDGFRHSYCSYRIRQLGGNLDLLAEEMGNSPAEIVHSYRRNVTDEAAEAWFSTMPPDNYSERIATALALRCPH